MADIEIKERILNYAADRYLSSGISKVSIDEIASGLGMSKKTLYEFFPGKKILLKAVVHLMEKRLENNISRISSSDMTFENKITAALTAIGNIFGNISRQFTRDMKRFEPELWIEIEETCRQRAVNYLDDLFVRAKSMNLFRKDIETEIFYLVYVNSVRDIVNSKVLSRNSFSADEAANGILKLLIDGALTNEARENHYMFESRNILES